MKAKMIQIVKKTLKELAPEYIFDKNHELRKKLTKQSLSQFEDIIIISIGKAAQGMAHAVKKTMSRKPTRVLLADSGHPLPTKQSLENTLRIIKAAGKLTERDLAIVLISGGGSAMLEYPAPGIMLQDLHLLTKSLLNSGANINEINAIRKHISEVKGGKFAKILSPATVYGFVISDVTGSDLSTIASGPLSPDSSTFKNALRITEKYKIAAPLSIKKYLTAGVLKKIQETPKPGDACFKNVSVKIIADHSTVLQKASEAAKKLGLKVHILPKLITGEARDAARKFAAFCGKKHGLWIAAGETTVTCLGKGAGGRNQEFVLAALPFLKPNQTILSIGTDGVDGLCPESVAGAVADSATLARCRLQKISPADFLRRNDSYHFFKKIGGHIKTGPTGTNLGDLIMLLDLGKNR